MRTFLAVLFVIGAVGLFGTTALGAVIVQDGAPECRLKGDPLMFGASSFLVPGLGQFFVGEDGKALFHLAVALGLPVAIYVAGTLLFRVSPELAGLVVIASPLAYLGWSVVSAMDAYQTSEEYCH